MSLMNPDEVISLLLSLTGLASFIGGFLLWWKGAIEKRYAAERAFNHIRADIQQLGELVKTLDDDIQAVERSLTESRTQILVAQQQLSFLATKLHSSSTNQ